MASLLEITRPTSLASNMSPSLEVARASAVETNVALEYAADDGERYLRVPMPERGRSFQPTAAHLAINAAYASRGNLSRAPSPAPARRDPAAVPLLPSPESPRSRRFWQRKSVSAQIDAAVCASVERMRAAENSGRSDAVDPEDGLDGAAVTGGSGKRKRSSVLAVGKRIVGKARKVSLSVSVSMPSFGIRRNSSSPKTPKHGAVVIFDGSGVDEEANPLLPPSLEDDDDDGDEEVEAIAYAVPERPSSLADQYDRILNAYPADQPPNYRSPSVDQRSPLARSGSVRTGRSADFWPVPHPGFESLESYFAALETRVWWKSERGAFEREVLDAVFARRDFNRFRERIVEDGDSEGDAVSSIFWPGNDYASIAGSDRVSVRDRRSSLDDALADIRQYGPSWAMGWYAESQELGAVPEAE